MTTFDLPSEVLEVLPSDPFEQLDLARKITSVALFTRISALESESSVLRDQLADRDVVVEDLRAQVESLNVALSEVVEKLSRADQQKEVLLNENASLSEQVKKLNRDVAKLESFRKTLMMSLQDEDGSSAKDPPVAASTAPNHTSLSAQSITGDEEETPPPPSPSIMSQSSDVQSSVQNSYQDEPVTDVPRPRISPGLLLASQTSTPRLTPPGSPPSLSASGSPKRTSKPVSPRRHSISFGPPRSMPDDRSSVFSSASSSPYGSMSGGRTRVDGKEFFRQVRGRLSYEQFSAFLANVKELNSHKQTKEDTLQKADDIFGPENKDLYTIFEGLISRNVH
ncbi:putative WAT1-related protein [Tanacetum coccineum]